MSILIKDGYIIDPSNKREGIFDILIKGQKISKIAKNIDKKTGVIIDAKGKIIVPGLIDMHVHLREPGREDIETIESGARAAIKGGITSVLAMPNTYPPMDSAKILKGLEDIIKNKKPFANIFVSGAITKGRFGKDIVDMDKIKKAGALAFTDDGTSPQDKDIMLKALKKAKEGNFLIIDHCDDKNISDSGVINEGIIATKLGLRGIPKEAEWRFVERDVMLAKKTKARIHIAHVSCRESVDIIRRAKKDAVNVTAETAPHYFSLTDDCCAAYDTRTKMNPPLRASEDLEAVKKALANGTIDAIASDHAPHGKHEKEIAFEDAAFGIIGLETSLALAIMNLIDAKVISWRRLVELMSANPAKILGLKKKGSLSPGNDADIAIIDPENKWSYAKDSIESKSKNSPFINWDFKGKATDVIVGGKIVLRRERFA